MTCDSVLNVNEKLYFLYFSGHFELAKLLLQNGVEVDGKSRSDVTALMLAAHKGASTTLELNLWQNVNENVYFLQT